MNASAIGTLPSSVKARMREAPSVVRIPST